MAILRGFEPRTSAVTGQRSSQLSYKTIKWLIEVANLLLSRSSIGNLLARITPVSYRSHLPCETTGGNSCSTQSIGAQSGGRTHTISHSGLSRARLPIPPFEHMVRDVGLEPTRTWTPVPKTGASAIPPIPHNSISGSAAPTAASLSRFTPRSAKSVKQICILFTSLIH